MRKTAIRNSAAAAILAVALASCTATTPGGGERFYGIQGFGDNVSAGDCRALAAAIGPENVWFSRFSGSKPNPWDTGLWPAWGNGCFKTQAECKRWLYNVQSEWPQLMDFTFCQRGLRKA